MYCSTKTSFPITSITRGDGAAIFRRRAGGFNMVFRGWVDIGATRLALAIAVYEVFADLRLENPFHESTFRSLCWSLRGFRGKRRRRGCSWGKNGAVGFRLGFRRLGNAWRAGGFGRGGFGNSLGRSGRAPRVERGGQRHMRRRRGRLLRSSRSGFGRSGRAPRVERGGQRHMRRRRGRYLRRSGRSTTASSSRGRGGR